MSTYKDDLDILKAAEKADTNKLTFNAITELDNKGLLSRYGNEGGGGGFGPVDWDLLIMANCTADSKTGDISADDPVLLVGNYANVREMLEDMSSVESIGFGCIVYVVDSSNVCPPQSSTIHLEPSNDPLEEHGKIHFSVSDPINADLYFFEDGHLAFSSGK